MIKNQITTYIQKALQNLEIEYSDNIIVQDPRNHKDIHYSTNIAMLLKKQLKILRELLINLIQFYGMVLQDILRIRTF